MTETQDTLAALVDTLYALQVEQRMTEDSYAEAYDEWRAENAPLLEQRQSVKERILDLDAKVRELALEVYRESGSKHPHAAVDIKEVKKLVYDHHDAHAWVVEQIVHMIPKKLWPLAEPFLTCLTLRPAVFEAQAKARMTDPDKTRRLDFVSYEIEPQTNVSRDLRDKVQSTEQQLQASINGRRGH